MTQQELREEIKMLHWPDTPEKELPTPLLNKLIWKAYVRAVTLGHVYGLNTDVSLSSGSYDMANIADFYEPRWFEYSTTGKLKKIGYEHIQTVPTAINDSLYYYYQKGKTLYVVNGDDETITVYYWAYPPALTNDTTSFVLDDQFSGVITARVNWQIAQGKDPKRVPGYIASYNQEFADMKQYYIKKYTTGRGYVMPMDY